MEKGFIVLARGHIDNYFGVDSCVADLVWPNLKDWNRENAGMKIDENGLVSKNDLDRILQYYDWLQNSVTDSRISLIYLDRGLHNTNEIFIGSSRFQFIGFDCVYLEDEYAELILFSTIYHELLSEVIPVGTNFKNFK